MPQSLYKQRVLLAREFSFYFEMSDKRIMLRLGPNKFPQVNTLICNFILWILCL